MGLGASRRRSIEINEKGWNDVTLITNDQYALLTESWILDEFNDGDSFQELKQTKKYYLLLTNRQQTAHNKKVNSHLEFVMYVPKMLKAN